MSNPIHYNKPKPGYNVDIVVTVRYHGLKATQYFSKWTGQSIQTLRQDLKALKIPHPKAEHIVLVSHGCIEFSWFNIEAHGVLYSNLFQKLRPKLPHLQNAFQELLTNLSITSATYRETIVGQEPTQLATKRSNPYPPLTAPPPKKKYVPMPRTNLVEKAAEDFINDTIAGVKTSTMPDGVKAKLAAEQSNGYHARSFMLKVEPVDAPIPPPLSRSSSKLTSRDSRFGPPPGISLAVEQEPLNSPPPSSLGSPTSTPLSATSTTVFQPEKNENPDTGQALVRELWDLRRQVTAGMNREGVIIQDLRKLYPNIPAPSPMFDPAIFLNQTHEIQNLQGQLQAVKQELENERNLRKASEEALGDIKREIKDPFIVPQLLGVLETISRLSSKVVSA